MSENPEVRLKRIRAHGQPVRLRILELLRLELDHTMRFSEIRSRIPKAARGSLVHHLKEMTEVGLIELLPSGEDAADPLYRGLRFSAEWEEDDLEQAGWRAAVMNLDRTLTDRRIGRIRDYQDRKKRRPRSGWKEPELSADGTLILTEDEVKYMHSEIHRLMGELSERARTRRANGSQLDNQQTMFITLLAFPLEDDE